MLSVPDMGLIKQKTKQSKHNDRTKNKTKLFEALKV